MFWVMANPLALGEAFSSIFIFSPWELKYIFIDMKLIFILIEVSIFFIWLLLKFLSISFLLVFHVYDPFSFFSNTVHFLMAPDFCWRIVSGGVFLSWEYKSICTLESKWRQMFLLFNALSTMDSSGSGTK